MRRDPEGQVENGDTLALLGHDLRALVAEMRSELRMVKELALSDPARVAIDRCRAAGEALSRLVDQSVMVCLGQAAPDASGLTEVATDSFLSDLDQRWTGICAASGHSFSLISAGEMPPLLIVDRTALERILGNLIGNAVAHTPPCRITATVKISGGDMLLLAVEDEGPGFPAGYLAALQRDFEIPPQARRPGGGLGLQSVKHLVKALGGRPHARNKSSGGAEVSVCLPLPPQDPSSGTFAVSLPPTPDLTGIRLLIADDSAASRELLGVLGRHIGAEVTCVTDGAQAIAALQTGQPPDLLILDAEMPGKTGLQVLDWLRTQHPALAGLPVLVLTSHTEPSRLTALRQAGASLAASKPILCPIELGRAVQSALGLVPDPAPDPLQASPAVPGHASPSGQRAAHDLSPLVRLCSVAGPSAAAELLMRLEEDLRRAQSGLAQAVILRDAKGLRDHSHVLIALAGTVGASALHAEARHLTNLVQSLAAPTDATLALAAGLDGQLDRLVQDVRDLASRVAGPTKTGPGSEGASGHGQG